MRLWLTAILATAAFAQPKPDAGGFPAPTPQLERGRTVYVQSSCHFCHGIDLTGAAMGAADLMHSPLVGADKNGEVIGAVVRKGLPNLQTAMPQYSDYTNAQIQDLAAYIHYLRRQGRYKELTPLNGAGDAKAGGEYFKAQCAGCHSDAEAAAAARKYQPSALRSRILRPDGAATSDSKITAGREAHARLLERYRDQDLSDLLAYFQSDSTRSK